METFKEYLERHEACDPAMEYAESLGFDVKAVIDNYPQADWLAWVVAQEPERFGLTTHELVEYGLKAAEIVFPLCNNDPIVRKCLDAGWECWRNPTQENIDAAAAAPWSAAAPAAAMAAWSAAWSAAAMASMAAAAVRHAWNATADQPELRAKLWELVEPLKAKIIDNFTPKI